MASEHLVLHYFDFPVPKCRICWCSQNLLKLMTRVYIEAISCHLLDLFLLKLQGGRNTLFTCILIVAVGRLASIL
ncbi:hypothetical protein Tsubulata_003211 [Turnera subulata]|uniref:Uncharacterized protein n=1 Tax=Turnera subulata TaxID=218843 RepID=A0A9Q0GIX5_9ROSI|nr:hypothetical protein Tsubulata_003211 [Turnera subulata]